MVRTAVSYLEQKANEILLVLARETGVMGDSLHPPLLQRKRSSTAGLREVGKPRKKIEVSEDTVTEPITIADTLTIAEAITKDASDAAIKVSDVVAETFPKSITESAQDAATNTPNTISDTDTVAGFADTQVAAKDTTDSTADTTGITIEADTGSTDDEFERQFKCDFEAMMAGIKSYRINKNEDVKDVDIESGVKWVNRSQRMRRR